MAFAERVCPSALQDLEPQQLLLFVQSFGIPVSSMSKLLQHLDQAVGHDPQTLEQSIMDKSEPGPGVCGVGGGQASTAQSGTPRRQHAVWGNEDGRCLVLAERPRTRFWSLREAWRAALGWPCPRHVLCVAQGTLPPLIQALTPGCCFADYMAHLVEVQHERGASGGQTFHSLLTASLPPRRGTGPACPVPPCSAHGRWGLPGPVGVVAAAQCLSSSSRALSSLRAGSSLWVVGPWRDCPQGPHRGWLEFAADTCSLPADSAEAPRPTSSPEPPPGQDRIRAVTQVRALGPEDDLAAMFLQVLPPLPGLALSRSRVPPGLTARWRGL